MPVTIKYNNTALISGASSSIIGSVLSDDIDPMDVMLKTLNKPRYEVIK